MRSAFVAGNWKMNGCLSTNEGLLEALVSGLSEAHRKNVGVLVPAPYLAQCAMRLAGSGVSWGGQDVSEHDAGAFTGEVSGAMLADFGASLVIVGHSERRARHAETNELVAAKAAAARRSGLTPIVCVGETFAEREEGNAEAIIAAQVDALIERAGLEVLRHSILAYEPVWAIGTGRTASPEQAQEMHAFIRNRISRLDQDCGAAIRVLYGGSVKASNARELFEMPDVDGGLVGGASLVASDFIAICGAAVGQHG